jgi:hypothetical protein
MNATRIRTVIKWTAGALGVTVAAYAAYVATAWARYGRAAPPNVADADALLDRFMPAYDIAERHHIRVAAAADITFAAACEQDLMALPIVRAIFKSREVILGSDPDTAARPRGILALTTSIGWGVLAQVPGREIVVGAVTQPWEANVVFRPLPPDEFAALNQPNYVKIVWTLRADPVSATESVFRTETRAIAIDDAARTKFRRYWSFLSQASSPFVGWLSAHYGRKPNAAPEAHGRFIATRQKSLSWPQSGQYRDVEWIR